jgi:hypothetical protein
MPSLDIQNPEMPDLQFVLFVSALCTADLKTLIRTDVPPTDPKERVLDLREGTELTLEACLSTIRSLLTDAGIYTLTWDHPVSEPTHESTPAAKPLIDRLGQLYPDPSSIVDPEKPASG